MAEIGAVSPVQGATEGLLERAAGAYREHILNRASVARPKDSVELSAEAIYLFMTEGNYYANVDAIATQNGISKVFLQVEA